MCDVSVVRGRVRFTLLPLESKKLYTSSVASNLEMITAYTLNHSVT